MRDTDFCRKVCYRHYFKDYYYKKKQYYIIKIGKWR